VERNARRRHFAPRKRRGLARHPDQASGRGGAEGEGYGPRSDLPMELRDDETDARGEEKNADVEEDSDLEPDRDELSPGHAIEERGLLGRQDLLGPQPRDGSDDVRVHVGSSDPISTVRANGLSRLTPRGTTRRVSGLTGERARRL